MIRHQPDDFSRRLESRRNVVSLVRLTTRCRYCDRRLVESRAVDVPHGLAHPKCWEARLRAGRPALWLVDRAGVACRSSLDPALEDGAHAALREVTGLCPVPAVLRERVLAFLQWCTARGLVPALPIELHRGGGMVKLHAQRSPQLFRMLLHVGRELREAEHVARMRAEAG